jgi:hypothetical protein
MLKAGIGNRLHDHGIAPPWTRDVVTLQACAMDLDACSPKNLGCSSLKLLAGPQTGSDGLPCLVA